MRLDARFFLAQFAFAVHRQDFCGITQPSRLRCPRPWKGACLANAN
jgi:hypothetical protein